MPHPYITNPEWEWPILLALYCAGIASGTYAVMGLIHMLGTERDRPVHDRMGFVPMIFMLITPILLTLDLGQPDRFPNLVLRSPSAVERGPSPLMFNPNSPMSWGTTAMILFAPFTFVAFLEALRRVRGVQIPIVGFLSGNIVWLGIGELLALSVSAYSGVLINVTNQGVWSDSFFLGGVFLAFSELSGAAVAAIVAGRIHSMYTGAAVRDLMLGSAAVTAILSIVFMASLSPASLRALGASLLVGPAWWIGAVGLALVLPIVYGLRRTWWPGTDRMAVVGLVVLVGVLAFRYATFFSAIAYTQG